MTRELLFIPQKLKTLAHFLLNCVACKVNPREGKLLTKPRPNKNSSAKSLHSNHYPAHIHAWINPVSKRVCVNQWVMSSVYLDMQSTVRTKRTALFLQTATSLKLAVRKRKAGGRDPSSGTSSLLDRTQRAPECEQMLGDAAVARVLGHRR